MRYVLLKILKTKIFIILYSHNVLQGTRLFAGWIGCLNSLTGRKDSTTLVVKQTTIAFGNPLLTASFAALKTRKTITNSKLSNVQRGEMTWHNQPVLTSGNASPQPASPISILRSPCTPTYPLHRLRPGTGDLPAIYSKSKDVEPLYPINTKLFSY